MQTQQQMYYAAERKAGELNELMMEMIRTKEITSEELQKLIDKRPSVYGRFSGLVGTF